jgi:hypothetical protein
MWDVGMRLRKIIHIPNQFDELLLLFHLAGL